MPDSPSPSGWNSTDDHEHVVPVRDGSASAAGTPSSVHLTYDPGAPGRTTSADGMRMQLAALAGVGMAVVLGTLFYFGADSLPGDLTGGVRKTVTITADGRFDPPDITVYPDETLEIVNANPDPQVIQPQEGTPELFATQVIFDRPFGFTVPAGKIGEYSYDTKTLAADMILHISVRETPQAETEASALRQASDTEIPLPTEGASDSPAPAAADVPAVTEPASSSSSSSSKRALGFFEYTTAVPEGGSTIIQVTGAEQAPSSAQPSVTNPSAAIPVNPFTVSNLLVAEQNGLTTKSSAASSVKSASRQPSTAGLHSGANLQTIKRPRTNTQTGPQTWMVTLATFGLFALACRRITRLRPGDRGYAGQARADRT